MWIICKKTAVFAAISVGIVLILLALDAGIPCPVYSLTGFHCPGCGSFRAIKSILKLDFYGAFCLNPFIFIIAPILPVSFFVKNRKLSLVISFVIIALTIAFTVMRNMERFAFLAPGV